MPTIFPLYTLTLTHNVVIAAGGGGDPLFGKKNGIVIMDSTTAKELIFFKTEDIIRSVRVYMSTQLVLPENDDELSAADYRAQEVRMERLSTCVVKGVCDAADNLAQLPSCTLYLTLVGMESFSHVKICGGEMHVLERYRMRVDQHAYTNFNIFLAQGKIFAYMPCVPWQVDRRRIKSQQEEYFYGLARKNDTVVVVREDGHIDVNDDWEGFFYKNRRIHKVVKEDVIAEEDAVAEGVAVKDARVRDSTDNNTNGGKNTDERAGAKHGSAVRNKNTGAEDKNDGKSTSVEDDHTNKNTSIKDKNGGKSTAPRQCYTFVFNLKKYNFDEEIVSPEIVSDHLVFYLKKSSKVVFIKEEVKEVEMERITCISNHKPDDECSTCPEKSTGTSGPVPRRTRCRECVRITCSHIKNRKDYFITAVGTASGTLYIFKNTVLVNKITPCAIPITSLAVKDNFVYYCSLNGLIDRRVIVKKRGFAVFVLLCVMIVGLALLFGFYRTYRW
ncbi:hypothetical protein THOM_3293 [Trachipleistophora hominis]|uniref:Uncharacterized protein n=1 Tax=Trachipleistophora hominis TaxID=72359 RepID=L7JRX1_TRAHO|nr:hypothetical protein THOM_3293 [Trachipleistophora hominis]